MRSKYQDLFEKIQEDIKELEEKRKNSKNIKKHILKLFKTKIDSFNFYYRYQLGEGIEFNGDWDCDYDDKWVPENDDQLEQINDEIYDFISEYFVLATYFDTDGYCRLCYENNKLLFEIEEEDPEDAVEFDFDKMQHVKKEFPEDYKPLLIKWEITNRGIIELKK